MGKYGSYRYVTTEVRNKRSALALFHGNVVLRDVRDRSGNRLATLVEPHDGTENGVIAAAQRATDRMYAEYPEASNIQSLICATDAAGALKWSISPNFRHLAEVGTDDACDIWALDISGSHQ
jgi:hypothetical protein